MPQIRGITVVNKKLRNTATGIGIGAVAGIGAKLAIGGVGVALMGTRAGTGLGGMMLGGAVLGGLTGAAITKNDKE